MSEMDEREWVLAGALEARNMVEVVSGPGVRMSSADEHVTVVPKSRAVRAERERDEAQTERAREQRMREAHYMRIREEEARAETAERALSEALAGPLEKVINDGGDE